MELFNEAGAAVATLIKNVGEFMADDSHTPSGVATGPSGFAFMGLRSKLAKLGGGG